MLTNIVHEVILKEKFYTAPKWHSGVYYIWGISWLIISFSESRLFKVLHELQYHEDFFRFELCSTCIIVLKKRTWSCYLKSWHFWKVSETPTLWALGPKCDCLSCFWKSLKCTGLLSWTCSSVLCSLARIVHGFSDVSFANFSSGMV